MARRGLNLTPVSTSTWGGGSRQDVPDLDHSPSSPLVSPDSPAIPQTGWSSAPGSWPAAQLFKAGSQQGADGVDVGLQMTTEVLGRGAFSQVVKARGLQGVYAVKFLRKGLSGDLENEARILEKLNDPGHPNVIRLLGRWNGGLVFPLYEGTLGTAIKEHADSWAKKQALCEFSFEDMNQPLCGRQRWFDWARQLAAGLAYVHSKQLTHGDLKPSNVCYSRNDDRLVLVDFSNVADNNSAFSPIYASSDLRSGKPPTPASDMYALGVVLLVCATGVEPYAEAKNAQQRLMWTDKVRPQESYGPESHRRFARELPLLDALLAANPPSAREFLGML